MLQTPGPERAHLFVLINTDGSLDSQQRVPALLQHLQRSFTSGDMPIWGQVNRESFWIDWRKNYSSILDTKSIDDATLWLNHPSIDCCKPLTYQALSESDFAFILNNATFSLLYHPERTYAQVEGEMRRESKPEPLMLLPTSSPSPTTTPPLDSPMKFKFRMAQFPEDNKHDANLGNASPAIPEPSSTYGTAVKSKKGRGETCSVCGVTVASDIKRHMRRHLEEGEQERLMIKCPYEGCDVSKMQKSNLKSHIRAQHTFEYIYCPDEINCSFRTHDDASMLRHRKRYHGYQPYHRSSPASSGNAASPWKGKKSFLTKAEKSTLLGVEDLDILPQYIQPWKNVRPPPKSLPLSGQNPANHRKSSSTGSMGYTFVNESSPVPRHLVATPVELAPRITAGPVRGSTFAVQRMGPKSGMINDFLANGVGGRTSAFRARGFSNPPPPPPARSLDELPRKYSLSALLHPTNIPAVRPESIPANMMELDAPGSTSSSPSSYYTRYHSPHPPHYDTDTSSCSGESEESDYVGNRRRRSYPGHIAASPPGRTSPETSVNPASPHPTSYPVSMVQCQFQGCTAVLPLNGPIVDEHWKAHHVPPESPDLQFHCSWLHENGERCDEVVGGIRALWRHAMEHYNVPIPCPLGCGRVVRYGDRDGVAGHLEVCENSQ